MKRTPRGRYCILVKRKDGTVERARGADLKRWSGRSLTGENYEKEDLPAYDETLASLILGVANFHDNVSMRKTRNKGD